MDGSMDGNTHHDNATVAALENTQHFAFLAAPQGHMGL